MADSDANSSLSEMSLNYGMEIMSANLQKVKQKAAFLLGKNKPEHIFCCLLSKKICIVTGRDLLVYDLSDSKIIVTLTFESNLTCVACCETIHKAHGNLTAEWIAISSNQDGICVVNIDTKEKASVKILSEETYQESSFTNNLLLSVSNNHPNNMRMLISYESGDIFVSHLYDPLSSGSLPSVNNFLKFNLQNYYPKFISFQMTLFDVDIGTFICSIINKDSSYLSIIDCSDGHLPTISDEVKDFCPVASESMEKLMRSSDIGQLKTLMADDGDCKRAVVIFGGIIYIWNLEMMCLELTWDAKSKKLLDVIKTPSDIVLFLKMVDPNSNSCHLSIEFRTFPSMTLKKRIEAGEINPKMPFSSCSLLHGSSINNYEMEENIYYFLCDTELRLMSIEQADIGSRILKLISKGDFCGAEKLAAAFNLDTSPALKAKLCFCVNYLNDLVKTLTINDVKDFDNDLQYKKVLAELFQCLKLPFVSCDDLERIMALVLPSLNDTTQMLSAVRSRLGDLEKSEPNLKRIFQLRSHLHDITHRLGTFIIVCCDFSMRDWKHFSKSPARLLFVKFIKKGWLESAEVIWSRHRSEILNLDLVKIEVKSILSSIPKQVSSASIVRFLKNVLIPEVICSLDLVFCIAEWILEKARQLEISEPFLWPQNAILLCQVLDFRELNNTLELSLNTSDLDFTEVAAKICHLTAVLNCSDSDNDPITRIQQLLGILYEVNDLKNQYGCAFSLSIVEVESVEAIAFRMLDRIAAVEVVDQVLRDVIKPYLLSKNMIVDDALLKYVEARINSNDANAEKMVQIIRCIENFASKCQATECLMKFASTPWVDPLTSLVNELISFQHPLVQPIRDRYFSNSLETMLCSYGFSRCFQYSIDAEHVLERIVHTRGERCIEDCLKFAKHSKYSASDIIYMKAEFLCSQGEIEDVVNLVERCGSYLSECHEDASQVRELLADELIEVGELNGSSRFCSNEYKSRYHQNAINMLSLQADKLKVSHGGEAMSLFKNHDYYESIKQRLSKGMQSHPEAFTCSRSCLARQSTTTSFFRLQSSLKEHLQGASRTNLDSNLFHLIIEEMAQSLPRTALDLERCLNEYKWFKLILEIFEETSDKESNMDMEDFDYLSSLDPSFEGCRVKFAWSDVCKAVKNLIEQNFSLEKSIDLVEILLNKRREYLALQVCGIISFKTFCNPAKSEEILQPRRPLHDVEVSIEDTKGLSSVQGYLKALVSSLIEKLFNTLRCPEVVLSLLCSCYTEKEAIDKLGESYASNTGKLKIQKFIATVALAYHRLKNLHQEFFPILALNSNWAYKLRQHGIKFNHSEKIESIPPMALCVPFSVSCIFQFTRDFGLNVKEVCLLSLQTLFASKTLTSPPIMSKATVFCREASKIFDSPNDLLKLLKTSLESTDGKHYEKIEFILNCTSEIEQSFPLASTRSDKPSELSTSDKLNFLNFLKSYKPVKIPSIHNSPNNGKSLQSLKKSNASEKFVSSNANKMKVGELGLWSTKDRLSFHVFFTSEMWKTIKSELNQNTVDLWRSVSGLLKISEDNVIVVAMKNIMNDALSLVNSCGDEISEDTLLLLINLNQSISSVSDAVKVCDWMIDCMPEMHLTQKLELYKLCESLCEVWLKNDGPDAASKVYSNCIYQRKKLLAKKIFIENGFHDLVQVIDNDFSNNAIRNEDQAERLVERLYDHEIIGNLWKRRKCFSLDDSKIYAAIEHLVILFELNLEKIQLDLLARWMPSNLQNKQEMENVSMVEGFEVDRCMAADDEEESEEEERRLVRAIHLLCHMNTDRALSLLKDIVLDRNERFSECRLRALRCLLRLFSPGFVAVQLGYSRTQLVNFVANLVALAQLEKLGISENLEEFSDLDKVSVVRTLMRKKRLRGSTSLTATLAAGFIVSYRIVDVNVLNPVVQMLIDLEHFPVMCSLIYKLLRSSSGLISSNELSIKWFQAKIILLLARLVCSNNHLNFKIFDVFLAYPGCIMNEQNRRVVTSVAFNYSKVNMEPCAFAISHIVKDIPGMEVESLLSQDHKAKVLARLEEWAKNGLVVALCDRIRFSIKDILSPERGFSQDYEITSDAPNMSHVIDCNVTFDGYFHNQESFVQEFQNVLDVTAFNATLCQM